MPRALAILAFALLFPALALAQGSQGSLSASLGPGYDSNPSRTVGAEAEGDGYLGFSASGKGRLALGEAAQLSGRFDLGLRKFFRGWTAREDVVVQQLHVDLGLQRGPVLFGAQAFAKWRLSRGRSRDYADGSAELFADWALIKQLSLRLSGGVRGFQYRDPEANADPATRGSYDWIGPAGALALRLQPSRPHVATLAFFAALPFYRGKARLEDVVDQYGESGRRDRHLGGQLSYSYRGPIAAQGGYTIVRVDSNSYGEASLRHRLWAVLAAKLPLSLFASAQLAWQLLRYPDGVFFSRSQLLLDDESQSSAGLKLAWAAAERIDVEARYSAYWIVLPAAHDPADPTLQLAGSTWWRHTASLGLSLRW